MEKALEQFNHWVKNSSFKSVYETLESKKFPITLAVQVKSDLLYLPINILRELLEKESIEVKIAYQDINCTKPIELKELLIVTQKDLNITKVAYARLFAHYLIYSYIAATQEKNYIDEWTLKIFFSRESCTAEEAAYIFIGVKGLANPTLVIDENVCAKCIDEFSKFEEIVVNIISSGHYDEMDLTSLIDETLELGLNMVEKIMLYHMSTLIILFKSWSVKHPLYMADKFCEMGVNYKNFSVHEQLIIKVLNDRKDVAPNTFKEKFPYLYEFLEKNKEPQEAIINPLKQHFSKFGEKGGRQLKEKKELRLLAQYEIKKGHTWTTFKAMLEKKHTQEIDAYDGIEGVCYSIYLINNGKEIIMYYSTDTQEKEQEISIYTLKRYFSEENRKIKESSELVSPV
ncbi:hypothetical protein [Rickettsiella endosymbiont of Dermanyssus gallinae]|uniref:hypothetical protein n=1 Tax=Rickettsiella endosymbiont of Dermanyssus gallinae TaxID=2856608 RepID=UPI001C528C50|nr:hypothetical protein [Rickettsiella endosymbiont of Dermanyssus gallinae]